MRSNLCTHKFSNILFQEEAVKTKRLQSVGELPLLVPTTTNVHGRQSIVAVNTSDAQDVEEGTPVPAISVVESSANKSPVNASSSECI